MSEQILEKLNLKKTVELKKQKETYNDQDKDQEDQDNKDENYDLVSNDFKEKIKVMEEELITKSKENGEDKYIHVFALGIFYYNIALNDHYKKLAMEYLTTCSKAYHYAPASYYLGKMLAQYNYDESKEYFQQCYKDLHNPEYKNIHKTWDENIHYVKYKLDKLGYLIWDGFFDKHDKVLGKGPVTVGESGSGSSLSAVKVVTSEESKKRDCHLSDKLQSLIKDNEAIRHDINMLQCAVRELMAAIERLQNA